MNSSSIRSNDSNQTKEIFLPSNTAMIFVLLLLLVLLFFLEKFFVFIFLQIIPYKSILIIVMILIHLYLLRLLIFTCAFPGKNPVVQFYLRVIQSRATAQNLKENLVKISQSVNEIISLSSSEGLKYSNSKQVIIGLKSSFQVIKEMSKIYDNIFKKYPHTNNINNYTNDFHERINNLIRLFEGSRIKDIFSLKKDEGKVVIIQNEEREQFLTILSEIKVIIKQMSDLLLEDFSFCNFIRPIKSFFLNNTFRTKEYVRVKTIFNKENEEIFIKAKDGKKIDCFLIRADSNDIEPGIKNNIVIICGPNLTSMEHLLRSWDLDELYLSRNTDTFFWNYRGYGYSEGSADFENVKSDVESVYDYIVSRGEWNKIGIHGLSVGGIPACHLGKIKKIDLLIADRTFGSIEGIISSIPFGKVLHYLAKLLFIPDVENASNFIQTDGFKILLNDPDDTTVIDKISLKTEISRKIIQKMFDTSLVEMNRGIKTGNILDYALSPFEKANFYKNFKYTIKFLEDYDKTGYTFLLDKKGENYSNPDPNLNDKIISLTYPEDIGQLSMKDFTKLLYTRMKLFYSKFSSCGDNLANFVNHHLAVTEHLKIFLNNFFIFGGPNHLLNESEEVNYFSIEFTKNCIPILDEFIKNAENELNYKDIKNYQNFVIYDSFKGVIETMRSLKIFIASLHIEEIEKDWMGQEKGFLIPLNCGHIAFYDDREFDTLVYLLSKNFYNSK